MALPAMKRTDGVRAARDTDRIWWLRVLLVLQSPRRVFTAIRDDSEDAARARQEPVLAVVWLAGMASVLAAPALNNLMDDPVRDVLIVAIIIFLAGGLYGFVAYWLLSGILHLVVRRFGSQGSYRRTRHLVGFAAAPLALALLTFWPLRIAIEGRDLFRYGGRDGGTHLFADLFYVFVVWMAVLVAVGVRAVHGWGRTRTLVAVGTATVVAALVVLGSSVL